MGPAERVGLPLASRIGSGDGDRGGDQIPPRREPPPASRSSIAAGSGWAKRRPSGAPGTKAGWDSLLPHFEEAVAKGER